MEEHVSQRFLWGFASLMTVWVDEWNLRWRKNSMNSSFFINLAGFHLKPSCLGDVPPTFFFFFSCFSESSRNLWRNRHLVQQCRRYEWDRVGKNSVHKPGKNSTSCLHFPLTAKDFLIFLVADNKFLTLCETSVINKTHLL